MSSPSDRLPVGNLEGSIKAAVAAQLRRDILSGTITPGEKLSEARLADRFGVSRMPVREALKELESAGFVAVERRRGTFVKRISRHDILDLFEVREAIEGMASRLCANRANNETIAMIEDVVIAMTVAAQAGDTESYSATDERLHKLIIHGAGNERLADQYQLLINQLHRGLLSSIVTHREGRMQRSLAEHLAIVRAIHAHDPAEAESAMRQHIQRGRLELADEVSAKFMPAEQNH